MLSALFVGGLSSCIGDAEETWNDYADWRKVNEQWLHEQEMTGNYERVVPDWNDSLYVLMRWLNDTTLTSGNLVPLYTSEVAVTYKGSLYDGTGFDSTYLQTDSIATLLMNNVIAGWNIAMERMHVGDHVELLIPYQSGYGTGSIGIIKPFSALHFDMILQDITAYEIRP